MCSLLLIGGEGMPVQYLGKNIYQDAKLFTVSRAGYGKMVKTFHIERDKSCPFCHIHYVTNGQMIVEFRGVKHTVPKGQLFILPPFEAHKYWSTGPDDLELNWLEFSCGGMCDILKGILKNGNPVFSISTSYNANRYIRHILRVLKNEPFPKYYLSKVIYSILVALIEACDNNNSKNISRSNLDMIKVVLEYIDSNIQSEIDTKVLANISGFSKSYFRMLFLKIMDMTPAKYILNKRISLAKDLLYKGNVKLDTLAISLGFYDTSHFTRLFKKVEGLTPSEFKKQMKSYTNFPN